ncbi:MAG TPA: helix-turn-helix transcriptional regulator [Xanthobacteraceae bacterium]|nr:helix-turn-helix transcriptional regulator [Xanthobacteraceae bacterium]
MGQGATPSRIAHRICPFIRSSSSVRRDGAPKWQNASTGRDLIAREFHLTPAEIRVLFAIVEVGNVPETAAVLGLSPQTVKTHLRSLFAKTATHRQAELVKFVAGYANTVLG